MLFVLRPIGSEKKATLVNSIDTNVLLYAVNSDCIEHADARALVDSALAVPADWIVADQVYIELYRLLRSPTVLERPLDATDATDVIEYYRNHSGWGRCSWDIAYFERLVEHLRSSRISAAGVFDVVLATTLQDAGVTTLYTRNNRDFTYLGWFEVINPISG